jgi:hypothetical protein
VPRFVSLDEVAVTLVVNFHLDALLHETLSTFALSFASHVFVQ